MNNLKDQDYNIDFNDGVITFKIQILHWALLDITKKLKSSIFCKSII